MLPKLLAVYVCIVCPQAFLVVPLSVVVVAVIVGCVGGWPASTICSHALLSL